MSPFCLKCRKTTESKHPKVMETKKKKKKIVMLLLKCVMCDSKKSIFIKKQKDSKLISSLEKKTPLSQIPSVFCFILKI